MLRKLVMLSTLGILLTGFTPVQDGVPPRTEGGGSRRESKEYTTYSAEPDKLVHHTTRPQCDDLLAETDEDGNNIYSRSDWLYKYTDINGVARGDCALWV